MLPDRNPLPGVEARLEQANRRLVAQLARDTDILGRSVAVERLRREVDVAAGSDAPALILGRQGSGREAVARGIHHRGDRSQQAFVEVWVSRHVLEIGR